MGTKNLKKILLLIFGMIGIFYYKVFTSENIIYGNIPNPVKHVNIQKKVSAFPIRLKIPNIGVNATLENVGITPKGTLDVPKGIINVGLYDSGPIPGEKGNAIIDGHFGYLNKKPAVFNNLYKLKKGDKIYVYDSKGKIITFIVNKIKIYKQNEDTSDIFNSSDLKAHLNLITCQGIWDKYKKGYPNRLVVFTDKS